MIVESTVEGHWGELKSELEDLLAPQKLELTVSLQTKRTTLIAEYNLWLAFAISGRQEKHVRCALRAHAEFLASNTCVDKGSIEDFFHLLARVFLINSYSASIMQRGSFCANFDHFF